MVLVLHLYVGEFRDGAFIQSVMDSGRGYIISTKSGSTVVITNNGLIEFYKRKDGWVINLVGDVYKLFLLVFRYIGEIYDETIEDTASATCECT